MTNGDNKTRIGELRVERIEILDDIESAREICRDDLAVEGYEYLRQVNNEIARLMAVVFA